MKKPKLYRWSREEIELWDFTAAKFSCQDGILVCADTDAVARRDLVYISNGDLLLNWGQELCFGSEIRALFIHLKSMRLSGYHNLRFERNCEEIK